MLRNLFAYIFTFFIFSTKAYAQQVDLTRFIAQPDFPTHSLSTGEVVEYRSDGSGDGTPVRQMKNSNYEQFFLKSDGIYRREDTSWAPFSGQQAICENGNKAAYTLDSSPTCVGAGQTPLTDGARWLPYNVEVGQVYAQQTHNILSFDTGVPAGANEGYNINTKEDMTVCNLQSPQGGYPACTQTPSLKITGYFEPGEYTFCTGVTNPAPVVTISGDTGAGSGDGFAYMENCGLAGFTDRVMRVGITTGCGITKVDDPESWTCSSAFVAPIDPQEYVCNVPADDPITKTITLKGVVSQATWTDVVSPSNPMEKMSLTGLGLKDVVVNNYAGDPCTVSKLGGKEKAGQLVNLDSRSPYISTNSDGTYTMPLHMTSYVKERFVAFSCNGQISDLYKCDLTKDTDGEIKLDVELNCQGTYTTVSPTGENVRPFVDLVPRSPGENIPLSDLNRFTLCVEAPDMTRPAVRIPLEERIKDNTGNVIQFQSVNDKDLSYLPPNVSPDPLCDPDKLAGTPYTSCMPPNTVNPLQDEFSSFTEITHMGKAQYDAFTNEAKLACGDFLQQTKLRFHNDPDAPAPTSPNSSNKDILPTLEYVASMNAHKGTGATDVLGKINMTRIDQGIVSKFATTPANFDDLLKHLDPEMCFAYNKAGECVLLGEVEVPGYNKRTLFEIMNFPGTGKRYEEKFFPQTCVLMTANSMRKTSPLKVYTGNDDDIAVTAMYDDVEGKCSQNPYECMRDYPIGGTLGVEDPDTGAVSEHTTTGRRSYAAMTNAETPTTDAQIVAGCVARGGKNCTAPESNGMANILTYPGDDRTAVYETGAGVSPKEIYERIGDNECKKIGFPVVNYCMCAQSEHANAMCPNPLNEVDVPNEGDDALMLSRLNGELIGGSVLMNHATLDPQEFYGDPHAPWGGITAFVDAVLKWGFAIFQGSAENQGGACITYNWGDYKPGFLCPSSGVIKCTPAGTSVERDCECENECRVSLNASGTGEPYRECDVAERASCKTEVHLAECLHRIKEGAPEEWGANEHPDCKGDVVGTVEMLKEASVQENSVRNMFADAWLFPGEETNSCGVGGTVDVAQANYEVVDGTSYNFVSDITLGQTAGCIHQQKVYKLSRKPYFGKVLQGDPVTIGQSANPTSTCNAFNVDADADGVVDPIDFAQSLEIAANAIAGRKGLPTSKIIDTYGPYCIVEFSGSPYGANVTDILDGHAINGLDRTCKNIDPPRDLKPEHEALNPPFTCNGFGRDPGDENYDYYRGALDECPLKTHSWPDQYSMEDVLDSLRSAYYNGNTMDDNSNPALKALRDQQLPMVLNKAKEKNINPYLLIAFWGTESGWSNRPSCYNTN